MQKAMLSAITEKLQIEYPKVNNISLLVFCGYVVIWYLQIGERFPALGAIRFEFIYAALLTFLAVIFTPEIDKNSPLIFYVLAYLFLIIVQLPFSSDLDTSWDVFLDRIIKFAFMSFFIVGFIRSPTHMKYFIAAFLLACLKMGQEGFVGTITGGLIWENQGVMRLHGPTPLYEHPNSFSGMALGTLPFIYFLWRESKRYEKTILFVTAIFSLNIILRSGSRTGYVGFFALVFYLIYKSKNKLRNTVRVALILVILLPFIPTDYVGRFDSIFTQHDKEGHSTELRIQILKDAWQIFIEHPFGIGVGAFPAVRMQEFGRIQDTHNLYLQAATNLGIQGIIIFIMLIYKLLKTLEELSSFAKKKVELLKSNPAFENLVCDLKFVESIANATSAFIIVRLALGLFGMDLYEIYWWFAIGITISLSNMVTLIKHALPQNN
jgi:O-antigen ligase